MADLELTLTVTLAGSRGLALSGPGELVSEATGRLTGAVTGSYDDPDVQLTMEIEGATIGGSVTFTGEFDGGDSISGTIESGLFGGSWPLALVRSQ